MDNEIKLFEGNQIRSIWDNEREEWYFSIVDIVGVLTESKNPRRYWSDLKRKLKEEEGAVQLYENIVQLKLKAPDGIDEIIDPELTIDRALATYLQKGYTREWINQRLQAIQVRKELTDAWQDHDVKEGREYAILTNEITKAWSGMTTREYKDYKGLKKQNLRDNMTTTEIILNMLAEAATKDIANATHPQGLEENKKVAKDGGSIAGNARREIEKRTGKPVITSKNAIDFSRLISDIIKSAEEDEKNNE